MMDDKTVEAVARAMCKRVVGQGASMIKPSEIRTLLARFTDPELHVEVRAGAKFALGSRLFENAETFARWGEALEQAVTWMEGFDSTLAAELRKALEEDHG